MRSHKDMFTFTRLMFRAGLDSQYIEDKHLQKEPLKKWILSHMLIYRRRYKAAQWLPLTQFFLLPAPFSFLTSFRSLIKSHLPRKPVLVTHPTENSTSLPANMAHILPWLCSTLPPTCEHVSGLYVFSLVHLYPSRYRLNGTSFVFCPQHWAQ